MLVVSGKALVNAEDPDSTQPLLEKSREHLAKLATEFINNAKVGEGSLRKIYFENLYDPKNGRASSFGPLPPSAALERSAELLGPRGLWISQGHCVIGESQRDRVENYLDYLINQELVPADAKDNVIWVKSPSDFAMTLLAIAAVAEAKLQPLEVAPYIHSSGLHKLALEHGVQLEAPGLEVAKAVVDRFYDKLEYRNWIEDQHGPDALIGPRTTYRPALGKPIEIETLLRAAELVRGYEHDFSKGDRAILFLQTALASGGDGNMKVYERSDGSVYFCDRTTDTMLTREFQSIQDLAKFIDTWGQDLDITPFVRMVDSYTIGMMVSADTTTVIGPLEQILDPATSDYRGFRVSQKDKSDVYPELRMQMSYAAHYAETLRQEGFTGWSDEDLLVWETPLGELRTGRSESNIRRDGMTHLLGPVLADSELGALLLSGKLSLCQEDHVYADSSMDSTSKVFQALCEAGVELVSSTNPYGVVIIAPPTKESDHHVLALAVIARSDEVRDELMERAKSVLAPKA